jgi:hypothetical protein
MDMSGAIWYIKKTVYDLMFVSVILERWSLKSASTHNLITCRNAGEMMEVNITNDVASRLRSLKLNLFVRCHSFGWTKRTELREVVKTRPEAQWVTSDERTFHTNHTSYLLYFLYFQICCNIFPSQGTISVFRSPGTAFHLLAEYVIIKAWEDRTDLTLWRSEMNWTSSQKGIKTTFVMANINFMVR